MRARIIRDDSLPFNKKRRLSSLVPAAARRVLLERLEARQLLSAALDTSFGGNGMVDTPRYDMFNVQPDNKILLALMDLPASESSNVTLYRYNNDGTPDTSYGSGGTLSIHPAFVPQARWLSGGKLYVAAAHAATTADSAVFDLARYNADGSLDSTFGGGDGIASASFTGINPAVHGIVTASDGDLVVGGQAGTDAAVARFNSDGSLDTTFGGDGTVQRFIHANGGSSTLTVAPNGDAYISVGYYDEVHGTWPSTVYRFHRDGSSDNFAPGFVPETFQAGGTKKIIPDGNNLIRYNADDSQDATFNPNGLGFGTFGDNRLLRVLALPDDSILVSGTVPVEGGTPGQFQGFLAKLQPNGDLDTSFAPGGIVKFLKGYQTWGNDMQTTPDGKVVMHAGFQPDAGMASQGLARFTVPASSAQTPFSGSPFAVNSTIQAEDFDRGGEGIAYHDFDTNNNGGAYRPTEGVDIEATTDTGGGFDVGWTIPGDWMEYTINIPTAGAYTIQTRLASPKTGGSFHYEIDGRNVSGNIAIPTTGSFQTFSTITSNLGTLSAGNHVLRLAINGSANTGGQANFNWLKVISSGGGGGGTGSGLTGQYFNNMDFTAPVFSRTDARIDFNWSGFSPDPRIDPDTFSVRWTGQIQAPTTGRYTFYTTTDDGVRLTVNGQRIIDHLAPQSAIEWNGSIDLVAGQKVPIVMEYFERYGGALAKLQWSGPGITKQVVPQSNLFTTAATQAPAAPFLSKVFSRNVGNNQTQMVLNITPPSGADQLIVERYTSGDAAYAPIATIAGNSTSYTDTNNLLKNRVYSYRVRAVNAAGSSPYSNENANQTPSFNSADIGSPTPAGFTTVGERAGFASLYAGGRDIEGLSDQFHYSYVSYSGDFEWIAKLGAAPTRTNEWAKAGLMIRASLAANAPYIAIFYTPDHGYRVQYRSVAGGGTTTYSGGTSGTSAPEMQIVRTGDSFDLIVRDNGTLRRINTQIVDLPDTALVGMAATSHDPTQRTLVDFAQFFGVAAA